MIPPSPSLPPCLLSSFLFFSSFFFFPYKTSCIPSIVIYSVSLVKSSPLNLPYDHRVCSKSPAELVPTPCLRPHLVFLFWLSPKASFRVVCLPTVTFDFVNHFWPSTLALLYLKIFLTYFYFGTFILAESLIYHTYLSV
jgi:hypothetical protein